MPTTPDRPDGPPDSRDEPAGRAPAADRETVPVDVARRTRDLGDPDLIHETVPVDVAHHRTRRIDVERAARERATVVIDPNRETVKVPGQRRPPDRAGRAPLPVAAGFATLWAALL